MVLVNFRIFHTVLILQFVKRWKRFVCWLAGKYVRKCVYPVEQAFRQKIDKESFFHKNSKNHFMHHNHTSTNIARSIGDEKQCCQLFCYSGFNFPFQCCQFCHIPFTHWNVSYFCCLRFYVKSILAKSE